MRSLLLGGAVALLVLLLIALLTAPARMLTLVLGDELRLSGVSGTLWRGSAARAALRLPAGDLHLGSLRWSLSALSLLRLAPEVELQSAWGMQRAVLKARRTDDGVLLRNLDATVDAALISAFLPFNARGRLSLLFDTLRVSEGMPVAADGRLVWQDAGWSNPSGRHSLGSYAADLATSAEGDISGTLATIRGPVIADGAFSFRAPEYQLRARITSQDQLHPELERALSLVASPEENGYLLRLDGEMSAAPRSPDE